MSRRVALRTVVLVYLGLLLVAPVCLVAWRTFSDGVGPVVDAVTDPDAVHALWLTVLVTLIAVPLNAVFGVAAALVLVRQRFPGQRAIDALIDLPFALSPVVIGLAILLVYGREGWLGGALDAQGIQVVYALPGIVLATVLVSLPFVVREVAPVLREAGDEQEQAARTLGAGAWQTFRRVTLPTIRTGLAYGVVLATARALGEYGAVSVVSGKIVGETETLTLRVEERFQSFDLQGAYTSATVLALLAVAVLCRGTARERPRQTSRVSKSMRGSTQV